MRDDEKVRWGPPRVTIAGPLVVVALVDAAVAAGSPTAGGWWFAVLATVVGVSASALLAASFVALTDTEVVIRNGLLSTRLPRQTIKAVAAARDGVEFYYSKGEMTNVASAAVTGVLAGYFGASRTAGVAKTLQQELDVGEPTPALRRKSRRE